MGCVKGVKGVGCVKGVEGVEGVEGVKGVNETVVPLRRCAATPPCLPK